MTVAFSRRSSCASGLPTRFERPTTTASRPELYAVALEELDHTVRGARQETRQADGEPSDALGAEAVHVLAGDMLEIKGIESSPSGRGSWMKKPETAASAFNRATRPASSSWGTSAEKRWTFDSIPTSWLSLSLEAT